MGIFRGGGAGVLEGRSLSSTAIGSNFSAEDTPLFCCCGTVVERFSDTMLVLFSSKGGSTSFISGSGLEVDLLSSSGAKPFALSFSSLKMYTYSASQTR